MDKKVISFLKLTLVGLALIIGTTAQAGKVDQVKQAVKNTCQKDIPDGEVMDAVLKSFDCSSGADVKLQVCTIKCLKDSGNVVGK